MALQVRLSSLSRAGKRHTQLVAYFCADAPISSAQIPTRVPKMIARHASPPKLSRAVAAARAHSTEPTVLARCRSRTLHWCRAKFYKSDWSDGVNRKSLPAIMFLYFACLLPAVAFGGIATQVCCCRRRWGW